MTKTNQDDEALDISPIFNTADREIQKEFVAFVASTIDVMLQVFTDAIDDEWNDIITDREAQAVALARLAQCLIGLGGIAKLGYLAMRPDDNVGGWKLDKTTKASNGVVSMMIHNRMADLVARAKKKVH